MRYTNNGNNAKNVMVPGQLNFLSPKKVIEGLNRQLLHPRSRAYLLETIDRTPSGYGLQVQNERWIQGYGKALLFQNHQEILQKPDSTGKAPAESVGCIETKLFQVASDASRFREGDGDGKGRGTGVYSTPGLESEGMPMNFTIEGVIEEEITLWTYHFIGHKRGKSIPRAKIVVAVRVDENGPCSLSRTDYRRRKLTLRETNLEKALSTEFFFSRPEDYLRALAATGRQGRQDMHDR